MSQRKSCKPRGPRLSSESLPFLRIAPKTTLSCPSIGLRLAGLPSIGLSGRAFQTIVLSVSWQVQATRTIVLPVSRQMPVSQTIVPPVQALLSICLSVHSLLPISLPPSPPSPGLDSLSLWRAEPPCPPAGPPAATWHPAGSRPGRVLAPDQRYRCPRILRRSRRAAAPAPAGRL